MNRQTTTYLRLSRLMFQKDAAGVLDKILGRVLTYCKQNDLPALPSIVVNKARGTPGHAEDLYPAIDNERERVYEFDWYNISPPRKEDFGKEEEIVQAD